MQKEFKITLHEGDDERQLIPYLQANQRESFLFELFHNFFRQWKNTDELIDIEDVKLKLFDLKNNYNITLIND